MKAIINDSYGSPDSLELRDINPDRGRVQRDHLAFHAQHGDLGLGELPG